MTAALPQAPKLPVVRHTFDGIRDSIPLAREWADERLRERGVELPEDLLLILSELATNAVAHTFSGQPDGIFAVRLYVHPDRVRIEVRDDGPLKGRTPTKRTPLLTERHGRGLMLVDALAEEWGRLPVGTGVFAEVAR